MNSSNLILIMIISIYMIVKIVIKYMTREILYPIFLSCIKYVDSKFWISVYENLAYGICPNQAYISGGIIISKIKNKEFAWQLNSQKSARAIALEIKDLFTTNLGLLSQEEKYKQKTLMEEKMLCCEYSNDEDWNSIKKRLGKEFLLEVYVLKKKKEYNLTIEKARQLIASLDIAIMMKDITTDHISIETYFIDEISNITFTNGNFNIDS
ncbi:MAG: hypothetical protein JKX76_01920 [Colwellia sp.]|nr:hypothetical protein [Colwellia sp.]